MSKKVINMSSLFNGTFMKEVEGLPFYHMPRERLSMERTGEAPVEGPGCACHQLRTTSWVDWSGEVPRPKNYLCQNQVADDELVLVDREFFLLMKAMLPNDTEHLRYPAGDVKWGPRGEIEEFTKLGTW